MILAVRSEASAPVTQASESLFQLPHRLFHPSLRLLGHLVLTTLELFAHRFHLFGEAFEVQLELLEVDRDRLTVDFECNLEVLAVELEVEVHLVEVEIEVEVEVEIKVEVEVVIEAGDDDPVLSAVVSHTLTDTLLNPDAAPLGALLGADRTLTAALRTLVAPSFALARTLGCLGCALHPALGLSRQLVRVREFTPDPLDRDVGNPDGGRALGRLHGKVGCHDDRAISPVERHDDASLGIHPLLGDGVRAGAALLRAVPRVRQQQCRPARQHRSTHNHRHRKRVGPPLSHPRLPSEEHPCMRYDEERGKKVATVVLGNGRNPRPGGLYHIPGSVEVRLTPREHPVRHTLLAALILVPAPLIAQTETPPPGLAQVERDRSSRCVDVLERVAALDAELEPLALQTRRFRAIAQAIAIEDPAVVESLDPDNTAEMAVRDWFATDAVLAQRFVDTGDAALQEQRAAGREMIKQTVTDAAVAVQQQADSILTAHEETVLAAGPCDGAIFVRESVAEACQSGSGPLCDAVALPEGEQTRFAFVDDPNLMWDLREFRPWTAPTALQPGPTGQLEGARTIGYVRVGNVVATVALSPMLRARSEVTPNERFAWQQTNETLGLIFDHPTIAFTPGLGMRAALPYALADEDEYIVHFGDPSAPDVIWRGAADTGAAIEATLALGAQHVIRLRSGEPVTLTALQSGDPQYSIEIDTTGQVQATEALLSYMALQLSTDLKELVPPVEPGS